MAEAGAAVWWKQADADRRAARRVFDLPDERTFCQAVAKQQQAVEKAVKALAAAVRDAQLASIRIKFTHEVDKLLNALNRSTALLARTRPFNRVFTNYSRPTGKLKWLI